MGIRKLRAFAFCVFSIGLLTLAIEWVRIAVVRDGTEADFQFASSRLVNRDGRNASQDYKRNLHSNSQRPLQDAGVSYSVHVFYYSWYGNPIYDNGSYYHWNHRYLPHWEKNQAAKWPTGLHEPPDDIGANYYPMLGCYSSRNLKVLRQHMQWIRYSRIGVLVFSWYPPNTADPNGHDWEDLLLLTLNIAQKNGLKVTVHIEPYQGRTGATLRRDLGYILRRYGSHPAFYRHSKGGRSKPLIYVYDSYMIPDQDWRALLSPNGRQTIRGTDLDVYLIGLLVEQGDRTRILGNSFDGFYTYFASDGFTFGSKWDHWKSLATFAQKNDLIFVPSVGPGYVDDQVRPWNAENTKDRKNGDYYMQSWSKAVDCGAPLISITSFNEWHEGTQIEPAVVKINHKKGFKYLDYEPHGSMYYLKLTARMIGEFLRSRQ